MPTINIDGIDFDLALSDGEVLDISVYDRVEFLSVWGDYFDSPPSDAEIVEWASWNLPDKAQACIDWKMWSEAECNGVSDSDRCFSTGWVR